MTHKASIQQSIIFILFYYRFTTHGVSFRMGLFFALNELKINWCFFHCLCLWLLWKGPCVLYASSLEGMSLISFLWELKKAITLVLLYSHMKNTFNFLLVVGFLQFDLHQKINFVCLTFECTQFQKHGLNIRSLYAN